MLSPWCSTTWHDCSPYLSKTGLLSRTRPRRASWITAWRASDLLLEVGFLLPHTAAARMNKVRDLLQRASIQAGEVALIRGMVRQLRWALTTRRP